MPSRAASAKRSDTMSFQSILSQRIPVDGPTEQNEPPDFFKDLNFDQIVTALTTGKEDYNLEPFFCRQLVDVDDIAYRHEVMQDLEDPSLFERIGRFAGRMQEMRRISNRQTNSIVGCRRMHCFSTLSKLIAEQSSS